MGCSSLKSILIMIKISYNYTYIMDSFKKITIYSMGLLSFGKHMDMNKTIEIIYPYIQLSEAQIKKFSTLTMSHSSIYGTYMSVDLGNYELCTTYDADDVDSLVKVINNVHITNQRVTCEFQFKNQKDQIMFFKRNINGMGPYEFYMGPLEMENGTIVCNSQEEKQWTLQLTKEEMAMVKQLFKKKENLRNMWFVYKNFTTLYEKEFVMFHKDGKIMSIEEALRVFRRLLIIYTYGLIYESLY
jgi:hypothetical protein